MKIFTHASCAAVAFPFTPWLLVSAYSDECSRLVRRRVDQTNKRLEGGLRRWTRAPPRHAVRSPVERRCGGLQSVARRDCPFVQGARKPEVSSLRSARRTASLPFLDIGWIPVPLSSAPLLSKERERGHEANDVCRQNSWSSALRCVRCVRSLLWVWSPPNPNRTVAWTGPSRWGLLFSVDSTVVVFLVGFRQLKV